MDKIDLEGTKKRKTTKDNLDLPTPLKEKNLVKPDFHLY